MLQQLKIHNYALIKELDISFDSGLSVITGETGAGKSIIIGALGLLSGNRADVKTITEGEKKCVIEGVFLIDMKRRDLTQWFDKNDIDQDEQCIVRREIQSNGKSRVFVNDTPVQLSQLKELSAYLIDIHSQHQNLLLKNDDFQLSIVDIVAQDDQERLQYHNDYQAYITTKQHLQQLIAEKQKSEQDFDYISFQYKQLSDARLIRGEAEQLEQEQQQAEHTEDIINALQQSIALCDSEQGGVCQNIKSAIGLLRHVSGYMTALPDLQQRLESALIEVRDITDELETLQANTSYDPERLDDINERLDLINNLLKKHHKQTIDELLVLQEEYAERLKQQENYDSEIETLQKQLKEYEQRLEQSAHALTKTRQKACPSIVQKVESDLKQLGMPHAHLEVSITPLDHYTPTGKDMVQLLFAANKNQSLRPVTDIASGGEIARVMLSLKSLMAEQQEAETLIFDEIDTGVSGEVASNMGTIMLSMAQHRQILVITHLPQIAAKGQHHYKVYKQDNDIRTETHIRQLSHDERIEELAHILSGEHLTSAAIDNAKELLGL